MAEHKITISVVDDRVVCSPDPLTANRNDVIEWECQEGSFAIHFTPRSPFARSRHRARQNAKARDKVRSDAETKTSYKYFVAVTVGDDVFTEDPEIRIDS